MYTLRPSWATHALQRGVDARIAPILMGHQDLSTPTRVHQPLSLDTHHLFPQACQAAR